ncbi:bacillithiol system redox-active protein YtxJ [Bacillus sp. Marseille-P3661]|uniref:bacillithiol system redox-active protein YtxJ n=1 Tax=Bacillus sp. Marseille-P3661 TaxID=1936234 RepID=UPI000C83F8BE|nr:bacillithiol system redox-active protein YtxJ [Bacillus sp. Marseille-P3661]
MRNSKLSTIEEFQKVLETQTKFILIKHSLTCPISQEAYEEYGKFTENNEIPSYYLFVQEARPLSNFIAETFEVKHESPQTLLFTDGRVQWHASHWNITEGKIKEALETALS